MPYAPTAAVNERDKYHSNALRCVRTAQSMRDPAERATLLEIARAYLGRHVAARQDGGVAYRTGEHGLHPGDA